MTAFSVGFQFITGCMLGCEFVAGEDVFIIDLFIVRIIIEWEMGGFA